ncbi:acetyl-CoA carboxylase biotin carboxyl carrier protein subunit [Parasaccharibacter sp. TMW2.1882]|uniref:Biotin carboxyl carrier protein of acetyl-CoA carboxylase n=3 Tax=Acetobacteraceae TaxID=433 RepID=A0ABX4ZP27_9PROT|nr:MULTISPECIES: acetyl-CoA carboxylase biotin carboxyl carrier protein subunit [Acetobacteraceae]MCL1562960.1 acetyl-CoA carboxylase biotin carboxyl carrier protein subunit [Parasaccharibacter sp. TMW 2.1886]MCQ0042247.1 acetyl-CoA carboxylase biotin carboxyl carrier protein subunit [Bombella sp.]MUG78939.1 acetyl-CoA carboxylase biotin carboxyl carrier protein subunit [Bombella sp. ESL0380]MUH02258.1 acetyl-CoA carboxylase biotin carboxyl carrier protein subunit [Bombella sp. ESL0387]QGT7467
MSRMLVDKEAIRALADILTDTGLTEIEVSEGDSRLRVARNVTVQAAAAPVAAAPAAAPAPVAEEAVAPADPSSHPGAVPSPMVGVAYLTPDPSSPPFVQEGGQVAAGQTIMLIEAMKTFNQIKAPRAGKLVRYCVASGDPVEFGATLAIIE